jgi:hypothetical protein
MRLGHMVTKNIRNLLILFIFSDVGILYVLPPKRRAQVVIRKQEVEQEHRLLLVST